MIQDKKTYGIVNTRDFTLKNGLKVICTPRHYLPTVTVMFAYRVGGASVWKGKTGVAHFLEHMMFKGTQKFPKGSIDGITQRLGGHNNAYTTSDYTCYYFMFTADRWQQALEIEADRMQNCLLSEKDFLSEKKVILEELSTSMDNPLEFLDQELESITFRRHPYRNPIIGWREDIENLTLRELRDFYQYYYTPENALVVVVGDATRENMITSVKKYFEAIPRSQHKIETNIIAESEQKSERRASITHDVEISRFEMFFPTCSVGEDDDYILDIIDTILSTGKTSRLYRRLVTEEQVLQIIITINDTRKDPGVFRIVGEAHPASCEKKIEKLIFEELNKLKKKSVTEYELTKAKNIIIGEFISEQETNFDLAEKLIQFEMFCGYKEINNIISKIQSITVEDIKKTCTKYFHLHNATIGWSLPKKRKKIEPRKKLHLPSSRGIRAPKNIGAVHSPKKQPKNSNILTRPVNQYKLPNGLQILFMENHNIPNFAMSMHIRGGYLFEDKQKAGSAHLMGRLLTEGSKKYSMYKIASTCEFLSSSIKTSSTFIEAKGFVRDFARMCDMVSNIVQAPTFDDEILQNHKQKVLTSLISNQDSTSYRAKRLFMKSIYGNHPYGRSPQGTTKTIPLVTRDDIVNLHQKYFMPNNAVLSVVGNMDKKTVFKNIEEYFGKWKTREASFFNLPKLQIKTKAQEKLISLPKQQIQVYWGHLGIKRSNPDYYTLLVLDHILGMGSGFTDRLSKKVRDDLGLVYNIWSSITSSAAAEPGTFCTFFATDPKNYKQAISVIKEEIRSVQQGNITPQELRNAKAYLTGSFIFAFETNSSLADYLVSAYRLQLGFDYIHKFREKIEHITMKQIVEVANKYLFPEKATTIVAGAVSCL